MDSQDEVAVSGEDTTLDLGSYGAADQTYSLSSSGIDTITLNSANSGYSYSTIGNLGMGSITFPTTTTTTIAGGGSGGSGGYGQILTTTGTGSSWITPGTTQPSIKVSGDAEFEGDVKVQGQSLVKLLEKIEDRLAILMDPTPERLEKFQALKKAYDNYKLMDKLCQEDTKEAKK
jgi:hypothetical protein